MATLLFQNNASSTISGSITNTATAVNLQAGGGALFPNPGAGQYFVATFQSATTPGVNEIVWVTARSSDTLTIVRAQEGTPALAWNAGDLFKMLVTAGMLSQFLQQGGIGQSSLVHYGVTAGTNALTTTLAPVVTSLGDGTLIELTPSASNTAAVTLNPNGLGAVNITTLNGGALPANTLVAGQPVIGMMLSGALVLLTYSNYQAILSTNTNYYVNSSTGSDANNGLTSGTAFATLQHSANIVSTFNLNGYGVTINIANGTYSPVTLPPINGSGTVTFLGNSGSPTSVVISASSGSAVIASNCNVGYVINGVSVQSAAASGSDGGLGVAAAGNTNILLENINFGTCQAAHVGASTGAGIRLSGTLSISGGCTSNSDGPGAHIWAVDGNVTTVGGSTSLTVSSSVSIPYFIIATQVGLTYVTYTSITNPSNVTGTKYIASLNGVIWTNGAGPSYYPGTIGGSTSTGGQYA